MALFSSIADTQFNAFSDPLNPYNQNQGQWGMNPAYLTPNWDAPYRPPYTGGSGSTPAYPNPGFFRGVYGLSPLNIFTENYGVGTHRQDTMYGDSIVNKPMDAFAGGMQRFGVPLAAFAGMYGLGRAWQVGNQARTAGAAMSGWGATFGMPRSVQREWRRAVNPANVSVFTGIGQRAGMGAAEGMMSGASRFIPGLAGSAFARGAVGAAGVLGGIAGSVALPALAAQGIIKTADNMVFDNYIGVRENQNLLREAFRGVTFGEGQDGDAYTGQGLSRRAAGRMGTELTTIGAKDQLFNAREIATMTSMSAQMGMLDNVNADQITSKMSSIVKQLRIIMSIAGTTDFKEAINLMAKLQMAGVQTSNIGGVMSGIGALSSAAGISSNRMMNTVGAQGQYLFQANGITPYVGQIAGAQAMAGMASAFRSGLVSQDLMARMGGVEGASQLSVTGQVNASQTTYNMMKGFNEYTSGRGGQGVVGNVMNFGSTFAGNPLAAYGAMMRTRGYNIGKQFEDKGPMAVHDQLMDLAGVNPLTAGKGKIDQDEAYALLMQMGMSPDQAQAYLAQVASYTDNKSRKQIMAGMRSNELSMTRDYLEQTGQTRFTALVSPVAKGYREVKAAFAGAIGLGVEKVGGLADKALAFWTGGTVGSPDDIGSKRVSDIRRAGTYSLLDTDSLNGENVDYKVTLDKLNSLAEGGDMDAIAALGTGDSKTKSNAIFSLAQAGKLHKDYMKREGNDQLMAALNSAKRLESRDVESDLVGKSNNVLFGQDDIFKDSATALERRQAYEAAQKIAELRGKGDKLTDAEKRELDANLAHLSKTTKIDTGDLVDLNQGVESMMGYSRKNRIDTMDVVSKMGGADKIMEMAKTEEGRGKIFQKDSKYLDAYMKAPTDAARGEAINKALMEKGDVLLQSAGGMFENDQTTTDMDLEFRKRSQALRKQEMMIDKMAKEGRIDFKTAYDMTSGIQMNQAALTFSQAVQRFGENVGKMPGAKEVKPTESKQPDVMNYSYIGLGS